MITRWAGVLLRVWLAVAVVALLAVAANRPDGGPYASSNPSGLGSAASTTPTSSTTSSSTSSTTSTSTTIVIDRPAFISADYPAAAEAGSTVRFTVTCSEPTRLGDHPAVDVTRDESTPGFFAVGADLTHVGSQFFVDWTIPLDQPLGIYSVDLFCNAMSDTFDPVRYSPATRSSGLTLTIISEPPTLIIPVTR